MHQRANANVLVKAGAAVLVDDAKDRRQNAAKLKPILESLLFDQSKRQGMRNAAKTLGKPDAAPNVAVILNEMIRAGR
jgi:UDP-N-acetylglucosamine--N-acetylmuramyl-(pentapeptide) pyrophosphoryl-undecaprenol N-acetylglucosamine transferase